LVIAGKSITGRIADVNALTVGELIVELQKRKPDERVVFEWQEYPRCSCGENDVRCYCSEETVQAKIYTIDPFCGVCVMRGEKL
jgi:hypothetical protein